MYSILQGGLPWYLFLWWDLCGRVWFRGVLWSFSGTPFSFFLSYIRLLDIRFQYYLVLVAFIFPQPQEFWCFLDWAFIFLPFYSLTSLFILKFLFWSTRKCVVSFVIITLRPTRTHLAVHRGQTNELFPIINIDLVTLHQIIWPFIVDKQINSSQLLI